MRTSVDGVYAVGDVVATPQLAHVAFSEAIVAIKTMLGEDPLPIDYDKVPWGIYCHPEVGFCGLTEEQAKERGYDVVTSVHRWMGNGRALIVGETDGMVKIVAEKDGPILGVHIAGPWATELIAEGVPVGELGSDPGRPRPADPRAPVAVRAVRRVRAGPDRPQPAQLTCRRPVSS